MTKNVDAPKVKQARRQAQWLIENMDNDDMTVLHFEIEYKDSAKLCQDYGTFVQGVGTLYSPYILDSGFLAVELYPGAVIVGKDSPFYRSEGVTVHAI